MSPVQQAADRTAAVVPARQRPRPWAPDRNRQRRPAEPIAATVADPSDEKQLLPPTAAAIPNFNLADSPRTLFETGALKVRAMTERSWRGLLRPELLSYSILTRRRCGLTDVPLLGEAYRCWSSVWTEVVRELDGAGQVPSDDFTRQDEVGAIFHGSECIALSCFRWIDLSNPMYRDDSYFNIWPEAARDAACRDGFGVCIGSHVTVSPAWRKTPVRNLLTALTIDRFFLSDSDAILGTMRDDRGMAKLVASLGANTLGHATLHGVPVTLIAVYRTSVRPPLDAETEEHLRSLRDLIPREGKQ